VFASFSSLTSNELLFIPIFTSLQSSVLSGFSCDFFYGCCCDLLSKYYVGHKYGIRFYVWYYLKCWIIKKKKEKEKENEERNAIRIPHFTVHNSYWNKVVGENMTQMQTKMIRLCKRRFIYNLYNFSGFWRNLKKWSKISTPPPHLFLNLILVQCWQVFCWGGIFFPQR